MNLGFTNGKPFGKVTGPNVVVLFGERVHSVVMVRTNVSYRINYPERGSPAYSYMENPSSYPGIQDFS